MIVFCVLLSVSLENILEWDRKKAFIKVFHKETGWYSELHQNAAYEQSQQF